MIKSWYLHVREETMAPARMISFIEKHAASCDICQSDPDLKEEIIKITELVLPESKIPKAVRQKSSLDDDEGEDLDDDDVESDDDTDVDDTDDSDESDEDIDADDDDDLDLDDELSDEEDEI
ncbi:hypothetical protein [Desulfopila sp. IMCC35006]|uniref:hypothetical protein n=1 Tax=Desulfopila sp. IMCC35006 TaxID=2569542 RepID=UPI00142EA6C5|nr:hypothetical protein [Desulfopila sp. IMCC35006]